MAEQSVPTATKATPTALHDHHDDHLDNFDDFFKHLNQAANSVLPTQSRKYISTYALLLRWEDDDLGTESEIVALEHVLNDVYNYTVEKYLIPSKDPTTQLEYRLNDFRKAYDNGANLLFVYYGGHGCLDTRTRQPSRSIWRARLYGGASLVWSDLQGIMERAKCDVVFILDCCHAATASRGAGSKEGLWACNSEVTTTGVNDNSFTQNLIDELKSLGGARVNVAMLHARLMRRFRKPGPHMLLTEPWYSYLGDINSHSAELVPQTSSHVPGADPIFCIDSMMTETLVLLAVRLKETDRIPRLSSWQKWIHAGTPHDVGSVHALGRLQVRELVGLQAHFLSNSTLTLVSLPIFLWDRLPHHAAYSFVGFIKSNNSLVPLSNPQIDVFVQSLGIERSEGRVRTIETLSEVKESEVSTGEESHEESPIDRAKAYAQHGLWSKAEAIFTQVMATRQNSLGAADLRTLESMASLAWAYWKQGKWHAAEDLQVEVMRQQSDMLGEGNISTLNAMNQLAVTYGSQGRWKNAAELLERAMNASRKALGEDHVTTTSVAANLAMSYQRLGRWTEAESLQVKIVRTRMELLGNEHPDTVTSMDDLMSTHRIQGHSNVTSTAAIAAARTETPPEPFAVIPFRRDPDYLLRASLVDQIHRKLSTPAGRVALVGLGGVGKSLLAVEYCYWTRERSPDTWVLWLHASNSARFVESVQHIVDQLKIYGRNKSSANIFALLETWLRDNRKRWLLVLDNADDPRFLHEPPYTRESRTREQHQRTCMDYLPVCDRGSIIFTTRDKNAAKSLVDYEDIIIVPPMNEEHAIALLAKKIPNTTQIECDREDTLKLVQALDCMPLAITQAGAYINRRASRCSVRQYVEMLQKSNESQMSLLQQDQHNLRRDKEAGNSIVLTWQISFEHIRRSQPSATDLLAFMSFCDRQGIPEFLLRIGKFDPSSLSFSKGDTLNEDVAMLEGFSFISRTTDASTFEMHRLVQLSMRRWLEMQGQAEQWKERFVFNLSVVFPPGNFENWTRCQTLLSHAQAAVPLQMSGREPSLQWALIMYHASWYAREQGMLVVAEKMAKLCNEVREELLGEEHPDTLVNVANLASTYRIQGHWAEAEELEVKVMDTRKKVLGEAHPDTLSSVANLSSTYRNQGRWDEAEELEVKVMETSKKVLGEAHPDTLTSMANLASTYRNQGRWGEAEELGVKVVETMKKVLGEAHPSTLASMNNLASTYRKQGRWDEAEELGVKVVETIKKVLGEAHPSTLASMANLSSTYRKQGRWAEAEELGVKVMANSKKVLGEAHPDTLSSIANLASTYRNQGRWGEAGELEVKVMETRKTVLGEAHPDTLTSMNNLAVTYRSQGRADEADSLKLAESMLRSANVSGLRT